MFDGVSPFLEIGQNNIAFEVDGLRVYANENCLYRITNQLYYSLTKLSHMENVDE